MQSGADRLLTLDTARLKTIEKGILKPFLKGRDIRRYSVAAKPKMLLFPYKVERGEFVILSEEELRKYKRAHKLLRSKHKFLAKRIWFGKNATELSGKWYGMMYLDSYESFAAPHILTPSLSNKSNFALGRGDLFATGTAGVTSIIPRRDGKENLLYLVGILNSSLISFYAVRHSPVFSGGYHKFSAPYLRHLPIRTIDFSNPKEKIRHDRIVELVERMLALNRKMQSGKFATSELNHLERNIADTDAEINDLVFKLYDITDEERKIIEGAPAVLAV